MVPPVPAWYRGAAHQPTTASPTRTERHPLNPEPASTNKAIVILCTLDTKAREAVFLRDALQARGCRTLVVDVGVFGQTELKADVSNEQVAAAAGTTLAAVLARNDRSAAIATMVDGAGATLHALHREGKLAGAVSLGGGTGTHLASGAMRALPIGVPKLILSTIASRDTSAVIGSHDITLMHAVCDVAGLNFMSRAMLDTAAGAIAGMVSSRPLEKPDCPVVGLTSFGPLNDCAANAQAMMREKGWEVVPFHAVGSGSMAMEALVEQGELDAVLDLSLHEFADHHYGGYCRGIGPDRLETAGRKGIPHVILPGGLDMIAFECATVDGMPEELRDRQFLSHDFRSFVRASADDLRLFARTIAAKLNTLPFLPTLVIPRHGWSKAGVPGAPYHDQEADRAFVVELQRLLKPGVRLVKVDADINAEVCARVAVDELAALLAQAQTGTR